MEEKVFIAPRLSGPRFEDHSLPVNILEDFTALEDLLVEIAKVIYLNENGNRKRVPKGFSDGIYLKLVDIEEGSSVAKFAIASAISLSSSLPLDNANNFTYFEKAKDKIVSIIESVNNGDIPREPDLKLLSYFNKIGKNLQDNESIDFGYNYITKVSSKAILNKATRKKILLSSEQKQEYTDNIKLFALVPEINQAINTFQLETEAGNIKCPLTDQIKSTVFTAFNEYKSRTYISLKGTALFNWNDKIVEILEVESIDVLDPLDVFLRINNLIKLENNWYEGQGKALNKEKLINFGDFFNSYFDNKLALPAIFPTIEGNIQLEWKKENKNVIVGIELETLSSNFFYYNDNEDSDEMESQMILNNKEGWAILNRLIAKYL
ncbi:hypothetical protein EFA69_17860 [Rufibacter immobilis]|uniref:Uncharacterized protein n=1 Tax=Rufibacter immobilis TaxID=1348778 RepID=A0A3M9MQZ1_9BACT|nr:hypothetical protein [Rufibacter immobilis]RNI27954.1 hypothetical protein EFA69_17860 [Rufibacter immobilis]